MKLRMYLRGLALGIIVTAVVLSIGNTNKNKELTDSEIKAKAKALGMVDPGDATLAEDMQEESVEDEADVTPVEEPTIVDDEDISESESADDSDDMTEAEDTAEADVEAEVEAAEAEKGSESDETIDAENAEVPELKQEVINQLEEAKKEIEQASEKDSESTETEKTIAEDTKEPVKTSSCTITINRGNGSDTVARLLEKAGAVKSARDFDKYLCDRGLDKKISVGKYDIPSGADYEKIANIITNRK